MTPLERAARALANSERIGAQPEPRHLRMARDALVAIRDIDDGTFEMAMASEFVIAWGDYREFWVAMIDAALAE